MRYLILIFWILAGNALAGGVDQQALMNQELALDRNCEPGVFKKAFLSAAPQNASIFFWSGQRYAVARDLKSTYESIQMTRADDLAEKRISAIETQRDRSMGIQSPQQNPELSRKLAESDRLIAQVDQQILNSKRDWAAKCNRVIDENLRILGVANK